MFDCLNELTNRNVRESKAIFLNVLEVNTSANNMVSALDFDFVSKFLKILLFDKTSSFCSLSRLGKLQQISAQPQRDIHRRD